MRIKEGQLEAYTAYKERNSKDGYSKAVVTYADLWADLMEQELALKPRGVNDEEFAAIADSTSHKADEEGITGFMYGCAVNALALFWDHGERLRNWHNRKYGYSGGGTVNPAIVTIS